MRAWRRVWLWGLLLVAAPALAQESPLPPLTPPPPPPTEVVSPGPGDPPPPPPLPSPPPPPSANKADTRATASGGFRFAPTLNALVVSTREVPLSSVRMGLRVAIRERSTSNYSLNFHATGQVGVEGIWTAQRASRWGVGLTVRSGLAPVSVGGVFAPFADLYGFFTLALLPGSPLVAVPRFGLGLNVNAFTIAPNRDGSARNWNLGNLGGAGAGVGYLLAILGVILALALPNVELVATPPNLYSPGWTAELRFGIGF
jgi:hypothetical protein